MDRPLTSIAGRPIRVVPGIEFPVQDAEEVLVVPAAVAEPDLAPRPLVHEAGFLVRADRSCIVREDLQPDAVRAALVEEPLQEERDRLRAIPHAPSVALAD